MARPHLAAFILALNVSAALGQIDVSSPAFSAGGTIPAKYTCAGTNTNPAMQWRGVPANAKSVVIVVDDPDAPGGLFTHWLVWNIATSTTSVAEGSSAPGTNGKNDFGKQGYGGPCPPSGTHRYFFKVFALDRQLDLSAGAKRKQLDAAMKGHVVAQGELMAKYSKK